MNMNMNMTVHDDYISLDEALEREFADLFSTDQDPLAELIAAEDADLEDDAPVVESTPASTQSTNQSTEKSMKTTTSFDLNSFLGVLEAVVDETKAASGVTWKPEWLEVKGALVPSNNFAIAAGVIKAARRITDGLRVAKERSAAVNEQIRVQEARSEAQSIGPTQDPTRTIRSADGVSFAPAATVTEAPGFNPNGVEYDEALQALYDEADKHEAIIAKGSAMMDELIQWVTEFAGPLELKVEVGSETTTDLLGNEFRRPKMVPLDMNTLILGIAAQKAFIKSVTGR